MLRFSTRSSCPAARSREQPESGVDTLVRMPSHMVTQGVGDLPRSAAPATPFFAVSPISSGQLFPIPVWRCRDGRNDEFEEWQRAVKQLLNAFNVTMEQLKEEPPTPPSAKHQVVTRQEDEEAQRCSVA